MMWGTNQRKYYENDLAYVGYLSQNTLGYDAPMTSSGSKVWWWDMDGVKATGVLWSPNGEIGSTPGWVLMLFQVCPKHY